MSPSSSPSSSAGSPPDSSPADTTFSDTSTTRPSFVPLTLPPPSRFPLSTEQFQSPRVHGQSPPTHSTSETAATTGRRGLRHGKQLSRASSVSDLTPPAANPTSEEDSENAPSTSTHPSPQVGKKKRTRTLTTPYQSAVLHALLAQSRFPTTAMREEVGRTIGLSARKVQVWFQNQRQKARKPRSQGRSVSVDPSQPPPQFGPFNPVPSAEGVPTAGSSTSSTDLSRKSSVYSDELVSSDSMRGLLASAPGSSTAIESEFQMGSNYGSPYEQRQLHPDIRVQQATSSIPLKIETSSPDSLRSSRPEPSSRLEASTPSHYPYYFPLSSSRPTTSDHSMLQGSSRFSFSVSGEPLSRPDPLSDAPIILPPLRLDNASFSSMESDEDPQNDASTRADHQLRYSASLPSFLRDSPGGGRLITAGSPRSLPSSSARSVSGLPPPFTLQPRPQWHWDRPLGVVLPSIGLPPTSRMLDVGSGLRQLSSFNTPSSPRPRTTSDPALPPPDTRRTALLTEPWPLPPRSIGQLQQSSSEGPPYEPMSTGEKSSSDAVLPASNRTLDMDSQQGRRSPGFTVLPQHLERSRTQVFQFAEEDRMRNESATPRPSHFRL